MSIRSQIDRINSNIAAAYTACSEKGATMPATENSANLADTIDTIGTVLERKDVNFYDYDGTLLYSYTSAQALALSALPTIPTHDNLSVGAWNYTLSQIQTAVTAGYQVDVGAQYVTSDGSTRLYLTISDASLLSPNLYVKIADGTLTVEANGTTVATESESSSDYTNHIISLSLPVPESYPAAYTVALSFSGNGGFKIGQGTFETRVFGTDSIQNNTLTSVEFGTGITDISTAAFRNCGSLKSVMIPSGVTSISNSAFSHCVSLKGIVVPSGVTSIGASAFAFCSSLAAAVIPIGTVLGNFSFSYCGSLQNIALPSDMTSIGNSVLAYCVSLKGTVILPSGVTSIGTSTFTYCSLLVHLDLSAFSDPAAIPTLANTNALNNTPEDQIIYVKNQEMLTAFSAATNWSTYASRFQIKEV